MSVAVILPARLKSTRLPNKLLLEAAGKTILEHTVGRAREAQAASNGMITRVLVAADDEKLIAAAKRAGVEAVMTDPNHTSGTDRIAEAARSVREDIVVNLQADEPEIDPSCIVCVAALLAGQRAPRASMATLAVPIHDEQTWRAPNVVKVVVTKEGCALYFSRAPIPFVRDERDAAAWTMDGKRVYGLHHLGIYAYRREFLLAYKSLPESRLEKLERLEQLRALEAGHTIAVAVVAGNPPGIDTPDDYEAFCKRLAHRTTHKGQVTNG
ncbi:MAG: 3-deoxy-manno-octulosonate cytidylyltransferase [Planctomycetota bacterium]|nr:3-deoxy-manno-octulosonate cytidylyltransferase [Planctomycetota bacterium]